MKLMYNFATKKKELYDLRADPGEMKDLSLEQPIVVSSLYDVLMAQERAVTGGHTGRVSQSEKDAQMSQETKERLKSLGYLN